MSFHSAVYVSKLVSRFLITVWNADWGPYNDGNLLRCLRKRCGFYSDSFFKSVSFLLCVVVSFSRRRGEHCRILFSTGSCTRRRFRQRKLRYEITYAHGEQSAEPDASAGPSAARHPSSRTARPVELDTKPQLAALTSGRSSFLQGSFPFFACPVSYLTTIVSQFRIRQEGLSCCTLSLLGMRTTSVSNEENSSPFSTEKIPTGSG